jgi:hypothetical protein
VSQQVWQNPSLIKGPERQAYLKFAAFTGNGDISMQVKIF